MFLFFLLCLPLTVLYIGIVVVSIIYLYMGVVQLVGDKTTHDRGLKGAAMAVIISLFIIVLASYAFFNWVWPFVSVFMPFGW